MENPFEILLTKLNHIEDMLNDLKRASENSLLTSQSKSSPDILNVNQIADYLSVSKATIYKYTADRIIPHFKRGKRLYFKKSDVEAWVTAHRVSSNEEIAQDASNYLICKKRYRY